MLFGITAVLIFGIVAFLGLALITVGLVVSAGAALWYAVRRRLSHDSVKPVWRVQEQSDSTSSIEVQEVEVEVLPKEVGR